MLVGTPGMAGAGNPAPGEMPPGGPPSGVPNGGAGAAPGDGGATPSMVPLSLAFAAAEAGETGAPGETGAATATGAIPWGTSGGAGAAGGEAWAAAAAAKPAGAFIISIVPLNRGAAVPFRLKPHFVQLLAVSSFCVPQLGQNKLNLRNPP